MVGIKYYARIRIHSLAILVGLLSFRRWMRSSENDTLIFLEFEYDYKYPTGSHMQNQQKNKIRANNDGKFQWKLYLDNASIMCEDENFTLYIKSQYDKM